jgi:hypothetical protein
LKSKTKQHEPTNLTPDQKHAWRRIVKIAPAGVLQNSDEIMIELAAALLAEFQSDPGLAAYAPG